jgi:hypothetical protein
MYRPAPHPLTLVFPTRALPLKDDSASGSRSADGAAAAYRGRPSAAQARRSETCSCARTCSMQARRRAGDGEQVIDVKDIPQVGPLQRGRIITIGSGTQLGARS